MYDYAKMKLTSSYDNLKYLHTYDLEIMSLELMRNGNSRWASLKLDSYSFFPLIEWQRQEHSLFQELFSNPKALLLAMSNLHE